MVQNQYPLWKNLLILIVTLVFFVYALPNLYKKQPSVQISGATVTTPVDASTLASVQDILKKSSIVPIKVQQKDQHILVVLPSTDMQFKTKEILQTGLGSAYVVASQLSLTTPNVLAAIGAAPMKLGLDLQGGVHFLLQVDVDSVIKKRVEGDIRSVGETLRKARVRYSELKRENETDLRITFRQFTDVEEAYQVLSGGFRDFIWTRIVKDGIFQLVAELDPAVLQQARQAVLEQTMNTLRNRVNELGVSEALVQQQGTSRIQVDLPGIQDTAEAKSILGKTATLELRLVDVSHDARDAVGGVAPPGTSLYTYEGRPLLLMNEIVLQGSSITSAQSNMGEDARATVDIQLGGSEVGLFTQATAQNIGRPLAIVYVETKPDIKIVNGEKVIQYQTFRKVISAPRIQSALGNRFQITGLSSVLEARELALLLRAGALPATVTIIEDRQIGPTLGQQNIHRGLLSIEVGFALVVIFMALYYGVMGVIADMALLLNLVFIIAILSIMGGTLTLPGMAGIVLTVGMAVDANVLIFERIREELRNGMGIQGSIQAGYEKAFMTIVDSNLTTLIVGIVLFTLGSGSVKSFAVILIIGLLTSMFTAITGTRAIVNWLYGRRTVKKISIGLV